MIGAGLGSFGSIVIRRQVSWRYRFVAARRRAGDRGGVDSSTLAVVIAGGVFVMEAGSVILQMAWFRYTKRHYGVGRRVFLMAPIHHHFEKKGLVRVAGG